MKRKIFFFSLFLFASYIHAVPKNISKQICHNNCLDYNEFSSKCDETFFVTGIPKSGTNLIQKCICLMTNKPPLELTCFYKSLPSNFTEKERKKLADHFFNEKNMFIIGRFPFIANENYYTNFSNILYFINNYKTIFIIRDPRDREISELCHQDVHCFSEHPDIELLKSRIKGKRGCSVAENLLREYFYHPNILKIRYEDLAGEKSGGSLEKQRQAILAIANFLNIYLSDGQLHYICESLYGNTPTFRKGTIGQWKKYFDDELKEIYKKERGQLLIDFGYEKDFNW